MPTEPVRSLTLDEYHRMIRCGFLTPDDRVELLDGWIVPKVTHNPPHDSTVSIVRRRLSEHLPKRWIVRVQSSVTLPKDSEPEPDLAVVVGPEKRYQGAHPGPKDISLIVEVADASLSQDRILKRDIYACDLVQIYWIVNLIDRQIEVFTNPRNGRSAIYQRQEVYTAEKRIPIVVSRREYSRIPVGELLPPARG